MKKIILASGSPRRKALLKQIGLQFEIEKSGYEEEIDMKIEPHQLVKKMSLKKAQSVSKNHKNAIIIAADTLVAFKGRLIGKPEIPENAKEILKKLSGRSHSIITGFTIIDSSSGKTITRSVETKVWFKKLSSKEIDDYVKTGEPLDKAGAYGIQELGGIFIHKIEGDYYNVVGLPLYLLVEELKKFGVCVL